MSESFKVGTDTKIYDTARIVKTNCQITIGNRCLIGDQAFIAPRVLVMEDGAQIAPHAIISGGGEAYLGENSVIGFGSILITATDTPEAEFMNEASDIERRLVVRGSITLGRGAYIGSGAIICVSRKCSNISIGKYSVIGAGAYIDRSIAPNRKIIPQVKYIDVPRFACKINNSSCTMEDCPINPGNWIHCGYLKRDK